MNYMSFAPDLLPFKPNVHVRALKMGLGSLNPFVCFYFQHVHIGFLSIVSFTITHLLNRCIGTGGQAYAVGTSRPETLVTLPLNCTPESQEKILCYTFVLCVSHVSHCVDKMPDKKNLREEGFVWAYNLKVRFTMSEKACWQEFTIRKKRDKYYGSTCFLLSLFVQLME